MKKLFFFLISATFVCTGFAQTCVTATHVSTNFNTKDVTFKLTWSGCTNTNHLSRVWVFVDYREVGTNSWTRAAISSSQTPTVTAGNATIVPDDIYANGFFVTGTSSATVRVRLGNVSADKFDWCAFASDYPPNATLSGTSYTLKGTPPFIITTTNGTFSHPSKTYTYTGSNRITSITDATNYPGGLIIDYIDYQGCSSTVLPAFTAGFVDDTKWVVGSQTWSSPVTATHCRKTTYAGGSSGNYSTDCRSNNSTDAANASYGDLFSWCMVKRYAARLCPSPWRIPSKTDFQTLWNSGCNSAARLHETSGTCGWGATLSGRANPGISLDCQGACVYYISETLVNASTVSNLTINNDPWAAITPATRPRFNQYIAGESLSTGGPLRCVRD